jgi:ATP-dependent helicase/nuclease subunit A
MTGAVQVPAFEHNGVKVQRDRFYTIACDPRRSVAVEACAGAGKTWMLVSRMVRALLEGSAPEEILAITFTKKAAGEMRTRLQEWLLEFSSAEDDKLTTALVSRGWPGTPTAAHREALRGLHMKLITNGRPVQIRTFHGWFASLLRGAPLAVLSELGLPTRYELLEDDKPAIALVWRRFQLRVAQDPKSRADYLAAVAAYGRHKAHKAFEAALRKRTEFMLADAHGVVEHSVAHFHAHFPDFAALEEPMNALLHGSGRSALLAAAHVLGQQSAVKCQTAASGLERGLANGDTAALIDALFTKTGGARKLGDKFDGAQLVAQAQEFIACVLQAELQHDAWLHQQRMTRLMRGLVEDYAALKRERGWLDMGDLERAALALMSDQVLSGWVQERLDARVRHLLIDEFQDTNPLQWQALSAWLGSYSGAGNAPGVFIVGDPKQSIYRFRRAEPQVFIAAKTFLRDGLQGDLLSCDHTHRNAPVVIGVVNAVMGLAQSGGELDSFRPHTTESRAHGSVRRLPPILRNVVDKAAPTASATRRDALTTPKFEPEENRKSLECRQAAQWLAHQLAELPGQRMTRDAALKPGDVMVLSRKRERLGLIQQELARLGVPAQQPEKRDLSDVPEVQDIIALLDVLVSPGHDLSLARVLKSPLFGLDDAQLVEVALRRRAVDTGGATPSSWTAILHLGEGLSSTLVQAYGTLAQWKTWLDQLPPHDALHAIYEHGDVLARYVAAAPAGSREVVLANLHAVLQAALSLDGGRYSTAYGLVRALRSGGNAAPVQAQAGAVSLLTIHGAKGLEAPLVLLLDTDSEPPRSESMGVLVDWPGEAAHPRRFVFLASESDPPACVADALVTEQVARRREELNALYVAMTRAKCQLVLSSAEPRSPNPGSGWSRLAGLAEDVMLANDVEAAMSDVKNSVSNAGSVSVAAPAPFVRVLPARHVRLQPAKVPTEPDSLESRIGQAMHLLLERVPLLASGVQQVNHWSAQQRVQVARQFALDADQLNAALSMALGVLQGAGAWAWDAAAIDWHANEVPIHQGGQLLRIDRLVHHRQQDAWWVLDYKSSVQPDHQPELRAQLWGYREAIARTYPQQRVLAAFLTPQGALLELDGP